MEWLYNMLIAHGVDDDYHYSSKSRRWLKQHVAAEDEIAQRGR